MVMLFEGTDQQFSMDGYMKKNLDTAKDVIKKDWDMIFVYDGYEGSGKSTKACQDAFYCDQTLTFDRYAFNSKQFKQVVHRAEPYQAVIYDEAYSGLSSRGAMSKINKSLVSMLTEIRQKNLFVFIVLPCFFDLDKYVALWRSRALVHVYTGDKFQRGFFEFYNMDRKKELYIKGKKMYEYYVTKPNFRGRFTKHFPLDMDEYKKLKLSALSGRVAKQQTKEEEVAFLERLFIHLQMNDVGLNHQQKMSISGHTQATYYRRLKELKEEGVLV